MRAAAAYGRSVLARGKRFQLDTSLGICRSIERGRLAYTEGGWLWWAGATVRRTIVDSTNWIMCLVWGCYLVGPWGQEKPEGYDDCYHCGRRYWIDPLRRAVYKARRRWWQGWVKSYGGWDDDDR